MGFGFGRGGAATFLGFEDDEGGTRPEVVTSKTDNFDVCFRCGNGVAVLIWVTLTSVKTKRLGSWVCWCCVVGFVVWCRVRSEWDLSGEGFLGSTKW